MGYTTDFSGAFSIEPCLTVEHYNALKTLADPDAQMPVEPSAPDSYMQWEPTANGRGLQWDGGEKFYYYTEWLQWLIDAKLKPWGYTLSGSVRWAGEDAADTGTLIVIDGIAKAIADDNKETVSLPVRRVLLARLDKDSSDDDVAGDIAREVLEVWRAMGKAAK